MSSNKNNQSDEHRHRRLFTFACGAIVSPNTWHIAAAWGASRNAIQAFYSVAVRDALSLRSLITIFDAALCALFPRFILTSPKCLWRHGETPAALSFAYRSRKKYTCGLQSFLSLIVYISLEWTFDDFVLQCSRRKRKCKSGTGCGLLGFTHSVFNS